MRLRYFLLSGLLVACATIAWLCFPLAHDWYSFAEQESGVLSNGWSYTLYNHQHSSEPRFLLRVVESGGRVRKLQAHKVVIAPQANGTTAIQFLAGSEPWESPQEEWWDLFFQPGLWPHSQGMQNTFKKQHD